MSLILAWAAVICISVALMVQLWKLGKALRKRHGFRGCQEHLHSTRRPRA